MKAVGAEKLVGDVMSRDVVTVDENDNLLNLLGAMSALRFRHLPVIDDGRLVGLLTERDILSLSASTLLPHSQQQDHFLKERFAVRDVMKTDVLTVAAATPLKEAAALLLARRIGCLPVVDENNVLVGILTASDFVKLAASDSAALG